MRDQRQIRCGLRDQHQTKPSVVTVLIGAVTIHQCIDELQYSSHDAILDIFYRNCNTYVVHQNFHRVETTLKPGIGKIFSIPICNINANSLATCRNIA